MVEILGTHLFVWWEEDAWEGVGPFATVSGSLFSLDLDTLTICRRLSEHETDMRDKLGPSVSYLQRLGPEHMDQIFESAHWIFEQDADIALEVRIVSMYCFIRSNSFVDLHLRRS